VTTEEGVLPRKSKIRRIFVALLLVQLLGAMNVTIVGASLATIVGELDAVEHIAWIITAFTLAATVAMPVFGQLGDLWGRRRLFLAAIVIFLLGSLVCGLAQSMSQLALARLVQGLGAAGMAILAQTILADVVPARERAKYAGMLGSVFGVATVAGPVIGGILTDTLGWRWVFFVNIPLGIVPLVIATLSIPHLAAVHPGKFDALGAFLIGLSVSGLVFLIMLGGTTWAWHSPATIALAAGTLLSFIALVLVERRVRRPILPFVMFKDPGVTGAMILSFVVGAGLFSVVSYLPAYTQMRYGTSATVAGMMPITIVAGMIIGANGSGFRISHTGRYRIYPILGTATSALSLIIAAILLPHISLVGLALLLGLVGLGTGAFASLVVVLVQNGAPRRFVGVATSATNLVRQVGVTIGSAVVGAYLGYVVVNGLAGVPLPGGIEPAALTPEVLGEANDAVRRTIAATYLEAMGPILFVLAGVYLIGLIAAVTLPDVPLGQRATRPVSTQGDKNRDPDPDRGPTQQ
jgi:EmrB/QacA subfamily drug resistance transporter